jgi:hypothetical protein
MFDTGWYYFNIIYNLLPHCYFFNYHSLININKYYNLYLFFYFIFYKFYSNQHLLCCLLFNHKFCFHQLVKYHNLFHNNLANYYNNILNLLFYTHQYKGVMKTCQTALKCQILHFIVENWNAGDLMSNIVTLASITKRIFWCQNAGLLVPNCSHVDTKMHAICCQTAVIMM